MEDDGSLGAKFWFGLMGMILGGVIAAVLLFIIFGAAWYAWGFFGVLAFITVVGLVFGWAFDRREKKRRAEFAAE
jgi:predicted lipid-binding transport protein (Tim44 family)